MLPTLSVLIAAKNEEKIIGKCLDSLLNCDYPKDKLEIMVNVNGSSDNTYEVCKKYREVKTIKTSAKNCRAQALNELIDLSKGEIIGIFDADSFAEKDCLKNAIERFEDKNVMGVCGLVKPIGDAIVSKAISLEILSFYFMQYLVNNVFGGNAHFAGKNMYMRKKVFDNLGKLDVVCYVDDAELSVRMKDKKYKVVFEPTSVSREQVPNTMKDLLKQRTRWARAGLKLGQIKKNRSRIKWISESLTLYAHFFVTPLIFLLFFIVFLKLEILFFIPVISLLLLLSTMVYSRLFYNEPLIDMMFFPVLFLFNTILIGLIYPKVFIEEMLNKKFVWHDVKRK